MVLQEGDKTNQIPYYVLLEERATDPRDKEQYGKVAGTQGTLKQLNNLIYDLSLHLHWLSYLPAVSLISPDDTARITYLQE